MNENPVCSECGWRHEATAPCGTVKWRPLSAQAPARSGNPTLEPLTVTCHCPKCGVLYQGATLKPLEEGETSRARLCESCRGGDKTPPPDRLPPRPKPVVLELRRPTRSRNFYEREEE